MCCIDGELESVNSSPNVSLIKRSIASTVSSGLMTLTNNKFWNGVSDSFYFKKDSLLICFKGFSLKELNLSLSFTKSRICFFTSSTLKLDSQRTFLAFKPPTVQQMHLALHHHHHLTSVTLIGSTNHPYCQLYILFKHLFCLCILLLLYHHFCLFIYPSICIVTLYVCLSITIIILQKV